MIGYSCPKHNHVTRTEYSVIMKTNIRIAILLFAFSFSYVGCQHTQAVTSLPISKQFCISMPYSKTAVTPLLMHWSYCSLALSHQYAELLRKNKFRLDTFLIFFFFWYLLFWSISICRVSVFPAPLNSLWPPPWVSLSRSRHGTSLACHETASLWTTVSLWPTPADGEFSGGTMSKWHLP